MAVSLIIVLSSTLRLIVVAFVALFVSAVIAVPTVIGPYLAASTVCDVYAPVASSSIVTSSVCKVLLSIYKASLSFSVSFTSGSVAFSGILILPPTFLIVFPSIATFIFYLVKVLLYALTLYTYKVVELSPVAEIYTPSAAL